METRGDADSGQSWSSGRLAAHVTTAADTRRCPTCRTKIVVPDEEGLVVKNAILRVNLETGHARAKCPRCKTWVEVPLIYRE